MSDIFSMCLSKLSEEKYLNKRKSK